MADLDPPVTPSEAAEAVRADTLKRAYAVVSAKDDIREATDALSEAVLAIMRAKAKIDGGSNPDARRGRGIKTASGLFFYVLDPKSEEVDPDDIARSLIQRGRWNGAAQQFYSVASHILRVRAILEWCFANVPTWGVIAGVPPEKRERALAFALLHDAHEYVLPDMPRPIKAMLIGWDEIEAAVDRAIFERFGLGAMEPEIALAVKFADDFALHTEARQFGPPGIVECGVLGEFVYPPGSEVIFSVPFERGTETYSRLTAMLSDLAKKAETDTGPDDDLDATTSWKDALQAPKEEPSKWEKLLAEEANGEQK